MNASELAKLMLLWEVKRRELDDIETAVKQAVLEIGKSQTVGNVRAIFSKGRKTYDYEGAAKSQPDQELLEEIIGLFTAPEVDWKRVCNAVGIEDIPFAQGEPSVSIKLVED